jgi:hypothetical protein
MSHLLGDPALIYGAGAERIVVVFVVLRGETRR